MVDMTDVADFNPEPVTEQKDYSELHKLQDNWTFYVRRDEKSNKKTWKQSIEVIGTIDTIEMFWSVYFKSHPPSGLCFGCDTILFKENIFPMAEIYPNNNGCYIELKFNSKDLIAGQNSLNRLSRSTPRETISKFVDNIWERMNSVILGCSIPEIYHIVTGLLVQVKTNNNFRYQIWTNSCNEEDCAALLTAMRNHLNDVLTLNEVQTDNLNFKLCRHKNYTEKLEK
ncbi:MAG: translation initiation factor eIF4E [Paramarteilia canceri]